MKKLRIFMFICLSLFLVLAGCENSIPNPIVGTFILLAESEGAPSYMLAGFSFAEDGSFSYAEVIKGSTTVIKASGSYNVLVDSFNFVTASGQINITIDSFSETDIAENLILHMGVNPFLFDWQCDRNNGPSGMTLVVDANDSRKNYELVYKGSASALDDIITGY